MRRVILLPVCAVLLAACSDESQDDRTIVVSVYPLAFAAERVAGPEWRVIDLTPPGVEAHDLELSLEQRAEIERADLVVYLGDIGFQPQVEAAVAEAPGTVISLADQLIVRPEEGADPHLWLDPGAMRTTAALIGNEISAPFPRVSHLRRDLDHLEDRFRNVLSLTECRYRVAIVTHEAFHYMIGRYGFRQFGLSGVTPEAEPTAERLAQASLLIDEGKAGAVFFEEHEEARRIAESFAADAGIPALPLSTLESRPLEGDYFTVMEDNLDSLREGLGCR